VSTDEVWFGDLRIEPLEDGCRLTTVAGRAFLARGADPRSALKTLNIGTTDRKEARGGTMLKCPECEAAGRVEVQVGTWMGLEHSGSDPWMRLARGPERAPREFDGGSNAKCPWCGHAGALRDFMEKDDAQRL